MTFKTDEVKFANIQLANVRIQGTTSDFPAVAGWEVTSGRFLSGPENDNSSAVAVLGADVSDGLFPTSNPIGQSIRIGNRPFRVIGVLARKGKILGQNQDLAIQVPLPDLPHGLREQAPADHRGGGGARRGICCACRTRWRSRSAALGASRRRRTATSASTAPSSSPTPTPSSPARSTGWRWGWVSSRCWSGGIGIMNVMLVSVRERTREIGVRRALGARRRTIVVQFLLEAAGVSAIGGTIGTLLGLGLAKVVSMATPLAAAVQPVTIAGGIGFAAAVGLVFGIWPAVRAAQLDPVEALR